MVMVLKNQRRGRTSNPSIKKKFRRQKVGMDMEIFPISHLPYFIYVLNFLSLSQSWVCCYYLIIGVL